MIDPSRISFETGFDRISSVLDRARFRLPAKASRANAWARTALAECKSVRAASCCPRFM